MNRPDGSPWSGAGGAGRLQVRRVIDRRYGRMTMRGSTLMCRHAGRSNGPTLAGMKRRRRFCGAARLDADVRANSRGDATGAHSGPPCQDGAVLPRTSCDQREAPDFCFDLIVLEFIAVSFATALISSFCSLLFQPRTIGSGLIRPDFLAAHAIALRIQ